MAAVEGVDVAPSMFVKTAAYWVNGKEMAHFSGTRMDLRLTKAKIRARRESFKADARVHMRPGASDWVELFPDADLTWVMELFAEAVQAHIPTKGALLAPPPTGAELERRRRFH